VVVDDTRLFCVFSGELPSPALLGPVFTPIEAALAVTVNPAKAAKMDSFEFVMNFMFFVYFWFFGGCS
jgi:hypothetical protein